MKDLEKNIEDAAYIACDRESSEGITTKSEESMFYQGFISGAKSEVAREYWQQGMYSLDYLKEKIAKVYRNNGMTSTGAQLLREITGDDNWSARTLPNIYSEEEVHEIVRRSYNYSAAQMGYYLSQNIPAVDTIDLWFENNKKKS